MSVTTNDWRLRFATCGCRVSGLVLPDSQRRRHEHLSSTVSQLRKHTESGELALKGEEESLRKAKENLGQIEKKLSCYEEELAKGATVDGDGASALSQEEEAGLMDMAKEIARLEGYYGMNSPWIKLKIIPKTSSFVRTTMRP